VVRDRLGKPPLRIVRVPEVPVRLAHRIVRDPEVPVHLALPRPVAHLLGNLQVLRVVRDRLGKVPHRTVRDPEVPLCPALPRPVAHFLGNLQVLRVVLDRLGKVPHRLVRVPERDMNMNMMMSGGFFSQNGRFPTPTTFTSLHTHASTTSNTTLIVYRKYYSWGNSQRPPLS